MGIAREVACAVPSRYGDGMTVQRWLQLAAIVTAALILLVSFAAWRSAYPRPLTAAEIRERTAAEINRIEARAAEMERNASR
jgi:hypothetical protein